MTEEYSIGEIHEMEVANKLAYVLALVYMRIPWRKVGVKSAHKFFVDRIRASSNSPNINEFIDVFEKKCNVEFIRIDKDVLDLLNDNKGICMNLLRKESTFVANLALDCVDLIKEENKLAAAGQKTLGDE